MGSVRKMAMYRRLKLEELISKIEQIEHHAAFTLLESSHIEERQRLIVVLARQMRSHLVDQLEAGAREPIKNQKDVKQRQARGGKKVGASPVHQRSSAIARQTGMRRR